MELSKQTFTALAKLIHQLSGLVINEDKTYLVRHRLEPVVKKFELAGFDELLTKLQTKAGAHLNDAIVEAITTKETSFFRDTWLFDAILKHVLPERAAALKRNTGRHAMQVWSAATATGQEAYSLAMLAREFIDGGGGCGGASGGGSAGGLTQSHVSILASDISAEALKTAKAGAYGKLDVARGIDEARLKKHFHHHGSRWVVNENVSRFLRFRRLSLLDIPADLGPFDLVLCRNVLIYFDDATRQRISRHLHRVLVPGGWLALGAAESLHGIDAGFEAVKFGRAVMYRRM